jgi:hypothetical protein
MFRADGGLSRGRHQETPPQQTRWLAVVVRDPTTVQRLRNLEREIADNLRRLGRQRKQTGDAERNYYQRYLTHDFLAPDARGVTSMLRSCSGPAKPISLKGDVPTLISKLNNFKQELGALPLELPSRSRSLWLSQAARCTNSYFYQG